MPDTYSRAEVPFHAASTKIGQLQLAGTVEGEIESATLAQHSDKILVAALDNDSSVEPLTSKRRLGAFLGPLLKQYNNNRETEPSAGR